MTVDEGKQMKGSNFNIRLGSEMRKAREQKGYSLRDMGKLLNMNYATIGYWEQGKRQIIVENLKDYCDVLNIDYCDLLKKMSL